MTHYLRLAVIALALHAAAAGAADHLVGHAVSQTRFKGNPSIGSQYRITIKAGRNGNAATFALPVDPLTNGGSVSIERSGGALSDPLTAGTWKGIGSPPGSKGWKYKNTAAPVGGVVSLLTIAAKTIRMTLKGTGTMPIPLAPNAAIDTVIVADATKYCTQAAPPHFREIDGKMIKSKDQMPPAACPVCVVGSDSDGDRLDDCYETNTGIFAGPTDAGTNPALADTDGDAIKDGDEVLGSAAGLDLRAMGTNPLHKDILLEYDWFDDALECAAHSHRPTAAALDMVSAAFAAAPVNNPDGFTGINFIHDRGQGGIFNGGNRINDANGILVSGVNGAEFKNHKLNHFDENRHGYFHYAILPHRYNTNSNSSGQAELFGDDQIVSLYCAYGDANVAHTIVHELGHNLGLHHGGFEACNYKPNYNSVMNYIYQFPGIDNDCTPPGNGVLSYSVGDRIDLDENNLDENMGVCGAPAWDWNLNMILESSLVLNLNADDDLELANCGGTLTTLRDSNDWASISFSGISDLDGVRLAPPDVVDCINPAPH